MPTIHANDYSATTEVVSTAIARSVSHTESVSIIMDGSGHRAAIESELQECCDGSVATSDDDETTEFWGTTEDEYGDSYDWRVSVRN